MGRITIGLFLRPCRVIRPIESTLPENLPALKYPIWSINKEHKSYGILMYSLDNLHMKRRFSPLFFVTYLAEEVH